MFAGKKVEAPAEPAPVVIEPIEIAPAPVEVASGNKLKGLLGKFKR